MKIHHAPRTSWKGSDGQEFSYQIDRVYEEIAMEMGKISDILKERRNIQRNIKSARPRQPEHTTRIFANLNNRTMHNFVYVL